MYTKGEWYYWIGLENRHYIISKGKTGDIERDIAIMSVRPEVKANARLIASAPKLYVELVEADEEICRLCKRLNPQHEECTSCEEREWRLKALTEAKG